MCDTFILLSLIIWSSQKKNKKTHINLFTFGRNPAGAPLH